MKQFVWENRFFLLPQFIFFYDLHENWNSYPAEQVPFSGI
jgi:hypothetical protein